MFRPLDDLIVVLDPKLGDISYGVELADTAANVTPSSVASSFSFSSSSLLPAERELGLHLFPN
jgi:hypothetical protein